MDSHLLITGLTLTLMALGAVVWWGFKSVLGGQDRTRDKLSEMSEKLALATQAMQHHFEDDKKDFANFDKRTVFLERLVTQMAGGIIDKLPEIDGG